MTVAFSWQARAWTPRKTRITRVRENLEAELRRIDREMEHAEGRKFQQLSARYAEAEAAFDFAVQAGG